MNKFVKPLAAGKFTAENNLLLAPMAGITDAPFRIMCLKCGAGIVCAEMVSARGVDMENAKSLRMLKIDKRERPVSMQIFGSSAEDIASAARAAQAAGADIIDINAGCPVKKINKAGAGCVLIKQEKLLAEIVRAAVKAVKIPVTLKTRIGLTEGNFAGDKLAQIAENEGAAALVMHARYASRMHSGPADLDALCKAVFSCKIPVIGNGGVTNLGLANKMFETGVAGVMIGRGALGNPRIFEQIAAGRETPPEPRQKAADYLDIIKENVKFYGEKTGLARARKTTGYWLGGFPDAGALRAEFMKITTLAQAEELFKNII
ncbi:MAG: tRNA-dihydrouridine synthase [Elusimicrobium sp.]|nr:tRNA-dihydrouridine synthase [Elusimicrobium sp.]